MTLDTSVGHLLVGHCWAGSLHVRATVAITGMVAAVGTAPLLPLPLSPRISDNCFIALWCGVWGPVNAQAGVASAATVHRRKFCSHPAMTTTTSGARHSTWASVLDENEPIVIVILGDGACSLACCTAAV